MSALHPLRTSGSGLSMRVVGGADRACLHTAVLLQQPVIDNNQSNAVGDDRVLVDRALRLAAQDIELLKQTMRSV